MENIELSDCIYEHIKDTFYYGVFGDFKLVIDQKTGYFNATKLCVSGGKEYKFWARLEKSKKMVEYFQKSWGDDYCVSYEIKGPNNLVLDKQITGTYVPFDFFEDIKSWMKFKKTDKKGIVYVITNSNLEPQLIHKIGYAQNLDDRLSTFNLYRKFEPCFYPKLVYESDNAKKLETKVHLALRKYSEGNEFFKVSLDQIEDAFSELGYFPIEKHEANIVVETDPIEDDEYIVDSFYYKSFDDFKIIIDQNTGYFNATKLCEMGNKSFRDWTCLDRSQELLEFYDKKGKSIYKIKGDNKDKIQKQINGIYAPKELILDIASWISLEFYDRCSSTIINF